MPLGAFFLLLLQVIKRKYQLLNKKWKTKNKMVTSLPLSR